MCGKWSCLGVEAKFKCHIMSSDEIFSANISAGHASYVKLCFAKRMA